eukprot:CAMPEP_0119008526 /NCGR_PEP_ID=MMETSP1176-20130426/3760_1 /TAXON_ID=265551 /ORGANISM="Synedropsis recta cf, Strain CCMP1620" /LENGTH=674 /DNA_ID=CAMNT_0006960877 /DNA_START=57 /DNA_END=2081 /DNA_ORIENTATION=+
MSTEEPSTAVSSEEEPKKEGRERWTSKTAFYFAAIGAAVGFGNVWRFPALCADYGGGAFFIPYLMALFFIGIPLLILEISLGQYYQTGDVGVFGSFHYRYRGVGVSSVACSFIVVTYYSVLIAWVINAFFDSFGSEDPWAKEDVTGEEAADYFKSNIIGMDTLGDDLRPTRMVGKNVGFSFVAWFLIWACLAGGTKWTGRITYFTMGLPIVLLFVFLIRAVTLEGAGDGIEQYIGIWDMSVLTDRPDVWSTAVSQIFFSIGVTFGIMTAFGSYNQRNEPAVLHSCVIAGANSMFSFISGFAVFASLGHLAFISEVEVTELKFRGISLVFGTWPVVFGTLPGGEHWVRLLFFDLFLLGIDSGFGLLEGSLTAAADTVFLSKFSKAQLAGGMSIIGFLLSLIYCTDAGLIFLDATDFYVNFIMLLVGFLETFAAGWIFGIEDSINELGAGAVYSYMAANFGSVAIACAVWFGANNFATGGGFLALFGFYFLGLGVTAFFLKKRMEEEPDKWTWKTIIYAVSFKNVMDLREQLSSVIGFLPMTWAFLMKQVIPQIILILFVNLAQSKRPGSDESLFGHYEGYEQWPFQIVGYLVVFFACFLFLLGLAWPAAYEGLVLIDEKIVVMGQAGGVGDTTADGKKLDDNGGGGEEEEEEAVKDISVMEETNEDTNKAEEALA